MFSRKQGKVRGTPNAKQTLDADMTHSIARLRPGPLDIHAHVLPPALLADLARGRRPGFAVEVGSDGGRRLTLGGKRMMNPVPPGMDSLEIREKTMAEQGVAAQLISPWIALVPNYLPE